MISKAGYWGRVGLPFLLADTLCNKTDPCLIGWQQCHRIALFLKSCQTTSYSVWISFGVSHAFSRPEEATGCVLELKALKLRYMHFLLHLYFNLIKFLIKDRLHPPQCTKIDFRGSFRGARVKIENQDKANIDFFPTSGTTGFRSNFWYLLWKSPKKLTKCQNLFSQSGRKMTFH